MERNGIYMKKPIIFNEYEILKLIEVFNFEIFREIPYMEEDTTKL